MLAAAVNDRLAKVCAANPKRFAAFAALPTIDPQAAADELERCVTKLGFKGAMLHGMTNNEFLDLKKYWPIYERAEKLDVPIYFHPSLPHQTVTDIYFRTTPRTSRWWCGRAGATRSRPRPRRSGWCCRGCSRSTRT